MVDERAASLGVADAPLGNDAPAEARATLDEIEAALDHVAAALAHMG